MKIPLRYQQTEYDCGPTSLLNAISYLFDRENIPPVIIRNIMLYCMDTTNKNGEIGKMGTSDAAIMFLSNWFNRMGEIEQLPISSKFLGGKKVFLGPASEITDAVNRGGVAVVKVISDCGHYVLITKINNGKVYMFDPYVREKKLTEDYISLDNNHPYEYNHIVDEKVFNKESGERFSFGPKEKREAIIIYNTDKKIEENANVEYFI